VGETFCSIIAQAEQSEEEVPVFVKVGTVDSLRKAMAAGLCKPGVPILMDEQRPGERKGSRPASTADEVKKLTNVTNTEDVDGRCSDISFAKKQSRIFTANAKTPKGWFPELPDDPRALTPAQRLALSDDAKAIFKRTVFCVCSAPMLPPAVSKRRWEEQQEQAAAKIARVFR